MGFGSVQAPPNAPTLAEDTDVEAAEANEAAIATSSAPSSTTPMPVATTRLMELTSQSLIETWIPVTDAELTRGLADVKSNARLRSLAVDPLNDPAATSARLTVPRRPLAPTRLTLKSCPKHESAMLPTVTVSTTYPSARTLNETEYEALTPSVSQAATVTLPAARSVDVTVSVAAAA